MFSAGGSVSAKFAPLAVAAGAVVVDNTSVFRMEPDIPLVVPEVNAKEIANYKTRGIIANPNCSTIQMVVALKPIHDAARIKRVVVSTYQSVSGAGPQSDGGVEPAGGGAVQRQGDRRRTSFRIRSLSTASRISMFSWTTATPRKNGR